MSRLRCLVRKSLCPCGERLQSRRSGMFFLFSDGARFVVVTWDIFFQVFINYGPLPNNRLLRLYGFVLSSNPNDSYDIVLSTHPTAPFWEQKQKLWISAGLNSTCTISLTLTDPLPKNVLRYLRIQRLDESDLSVMQVDATDGIINESNEVEVLQFLVDSFCGLLENFGTQLEMLEEQLAASVHPPGGNAWAAAHVSLGEQRVLRLARKRAEDLLAAAESGRGRRGDLSPLARCANCDKVSGPFMLCGRCKAVTYCTRTCQVGHYKEHKVVCRVISTASKNGSEMK